MKKVILIDLINKGEEYPLPNKAEISIGRSSKNDIQIGTSKEGISKKHCKIYRIEDKLAIMDSGSKNGTYLSNQRLPENKKYLLKGGYQFKLSEYILEVKILDEEEPGNIEDLEDLGKQIAKKLDKLGDSDTEYDLRKDFN